MDTRIFIVTVNEQRDWAGSWTVIQSDSRSNQKPPDLDLFCLGIIRLACELLVYLWNTVLHWLQGFYRLLDCLPANCLGVLCGLTNPSLVFRLHCKPARAGRHIHQTSHDRPWRHSSIYGRGGFSFKSLLDELWARGKREEMEGLTKLTCHETCPDCLNLLSISHHEFHANL